MVNDMQNALGLMAEHMKESADARGLPNSFKQLSPNDVGRMRTYINWLNFKVGEKSYYYANGTLLEAGADKWGHIGRNINHKAALLVSDKFSAKKHLKKHGFNVPDGRFFRRRHIDEALKEFDSLRKPLCVKPNNGSEGRHVYTSITERTWYEAALRQVAEVKSTILVEEHVNGGHFRFMYLSPQVIAIRQGDPIHVIGDGNSTITELVETLNAERRDRALPTHLPYVIDEMNVDFLKMQGLKVTDIVSHGKKIYLSGASNGTVGGDTVLLDKTEVHPSYCTLVEEACRSVPGLHFSGVDLIIEDITKPANQENYWFLELNVSPAITAYYYPWKGEKVDVAGLVLDYLAEGHDFS